MKFDLIVIGSGMSGMTIANKCAAKGLKTAVTDSRPYGGTCALRGCDPKKILIGAAEIIDRANKMSNIGISGKVEINWNELMAYKNDFVSNMPPRVEKGYQKNDVTMFHGAASFDSLNSIKIGDDILESDKIVISTGAKARTLNIPGNDLCIDSSDFLHLDSLPNHVTFIGGGYISFEFAHLVARAGSKATILHKGERPLENFDEDMVDHLVKATEGLNIDLKLKSEVVAIEKTNNHLLVTAKSENSTQTIQTDMVVNAAGRVPELDGLNLEKANVEYGKKGIIVNEFLQSKSNSSVYAAGDCAATQGLNLTPVAVMEGHAVASNIIRGNSKKPDYTEMPSSLFTLPPLSAVGFTEKELKDKEISYHVNSGSAKDWYNAKRINESTYAYKVLLNDEGYILGAHLIGPHSEETINLFALAIKNKIKANSLKSFVYSYPSMASDVGSMV